MSNSQQTMRLETSEPVDFTLDFDLGVGEAAECEGGNSFLILASRSATLFSKNLKKKQRKPE